jgi:hypothetical protein
MPLALKFIPIFDSLPLSLGSVDFGSAGIYKVILSPQYVTLDPHFLSPARAPRRYNHCPIIPILGLIDIHHHS